MRMRMKLKARGTLIRKRRKVGVYVVLVDAEDVSSLLVILTTVSFFQRKSVKCFVIHVSALM